MTQRELTTLEHIAYLSSNCSDSRRDRDLEIIQAREEGCTYQEIATAANLTAAGVGKIIRKHLGILDKPIDNSVYESTL